MELALNMGAFEALDNNELFAVDGGKKASEVWGQISIAAGILSLTTPPPASTAFGVISLGAAVTSVVLEAMGY